MADTGKRDDGDGDGPSLEMPSFSLRRRRKAPAPTPGPTVDPVATARTPATETQMSGGPGTVDPPQKVAGPPLGARVRLPSMGGLPAAVLTGVVVGALAVVLAWLAGAGCEAVRGTSSCGGAIGLPILLGGLVLLAWVGSLALRALGVADPGSTSLLAVGVLAVLVMVFLLGSLDEWWSAVAVPVLAVAAFVGSWWLTTSVVGDDTAATGRTPHDVR